MDTVEIDIEEFSDEFHMMNSDPGEFAGVFFEKNLVGLEALKLIDNTPVVVSLKDPRIPSSFYERLWIQTPNENYGFLTGEGIIKGLLVEDDKNYPHCIYNIYDGNTGTMYCAMNVQYYKTELCNENCPFFKNEKTYLIDSLNSSFSSELAVLYGTYLNVYDSYTPSESIDPQVLNLSEDKTVLQDTTALTNTGFLENSSSFNSNMSLDLTKDFFLILNKINNLTSPIIKIVSESVANAPVYEEDIYLDNYYSTQNSKLDVLISKRDEMSDTFNNIKFKKSDNELSVSTPDIYTIKNRIIVDNDVTYVIDNQNNLWGIGDSSKFDFAGYEIILDLAGIQSETGTEVYVDVTLEPFKAG